jgi:hypothetical protein
MPLETCIADIFAEINTPTDSGAIAHPAYSGYILTEGDAAGGGTGGGGTITGNLTGGAQFVLGPGGGSSGTVIVTITGSWTGAIQIAQVRGTILRIFTANVSNELIFGVPGPDQFQAYTGLGGLTGSAIVTFNAVGNRIKIMEGGIWTGGFLKLKGTQ